MNYSENAINVFKKLYYRRDFKDNFIEKTPEDVFTRVSKAVAVDDTDLELKFFNMMNDGYFRPNSPCLMNAGVQEKPQTAACFVSGMQDDLISILDTDREAAIIFSSGSGIGANFGVLREKGALLSSSGRSSGPLSFVKKLASTGEAVKSGGRARRAAILIMFFDNHPDLIDFIHLKDGADQQTLRSMNLSIAITNNFMEAVEKDLDWNLMGVTDGKVKKTIKAREIFDLIANNAWKSGDPGVWFIDRVNDDNGLIKEYGRMISTNPCGEISGLKFYACALASINLAKFVNLSKNTFDFDKLIEIAKYGTIFLDNMIEISGYPTPDYEKMARDTRPIGLGIMGMSDMLSLLEIPYDSQEAFDLCSKITAQMTKTSIETSIKLGEEKGSFPAFENNREVMANVCASFQVNLDSNTPLRNSNWTTIAPTGSISISCDCSAGMEPHFGICYVKNVVDSNEKWIFVNPIFEQKYKDKYWYNQAIKEIAKNHGSCQGITCVPTDVQKIWKVAHDIDWKDRIEMQAALQNGGISNSISSTLNMPRSSTVDEIKDIYMMAWKKGLKGITVYRDGSLEDQPVEFKQKEKDEIIESKPKIRDGKTYTVETGHGSIHITVTKDSQGKLIELFSNGGKGGGVNAAQLEAIGRLISLSLQADVKMEKIAKQLTGISDNSVAWDRLDPNDEKSIPILSIPDAIGKLLYKFYVNTDTAVELEKASAATLAKTEKSYLTCPECGGPAEMKEGCLFCPTCGSRCS